MQVTNPATEEVASIADTPLDEIPAAIESARTAQAAWREVSLADRVATLLPLADSITARADHIAECITQDMGKPIRKSKGEVGYVATQFKFFCEQALEWLAPDEAPTGYVQFDPLGIVAVISPWNVPLIAPLLAIAPALLAGNGVAFKPSEYTLRTGIEIGKLFDQLAKQSEAFPAGLVQTIVGGKDHGRQLVESDVDMVSFTGSGRVGKEIMKVSAERVRPVILELGGLDAAIVLKDADLMNAARQLVRNNCSNSGQICCAVKRVYVEHEVYDEFVNAAVAESNKISMGDPLDNVDMGPLVAEFQLEKVSATVEDARTKGASVLTGGTRPAGKGYFYPSTVITNVTSEMQILNDEPFGPVLPIVAVKDWQEGVRLANDTRYGLTGSVWTHDVELGKRVMGKLEVGVAGLNTHGIGPAGTPFGGAKESGIGRIKDREGMRAYTNVKMIRVG